jgi:hypothetical protein
MADAGLDWYHYMQHTASAYETPRSITFSNVVTHNHFALDNGGGVFGSHAPVIKFSEDYPVRAVYELLSVLNSSTACFWMKQVFQDKGVGGIGGGIGDEAWEPRYEFGGTGMQGFPLPRARSTPLAVTLDEMARERVASAANGILVRALDAGASLGDALKNGQSRAVEILRRMVALQEELDWQCYLWCELVSEALVHPCPPDINLGERAFEIVLARRMAAGEEQTAWFERHGSKPITELPSHWPDDYRSIVEKRIALIESDRYVGLIERPEYKRRWSTESWEDHEQRALREWLLNRLETERYWPSSGTMRLRSAFQLADIARTDPEFMHVATLYKGRDDFEVAGLVAELTESEAVPYLAALRYTEDGMRKRKEWEQTWSLQRQEDAVDAQVVGSMPQRSGEGDEDYQKRLAGAQRTARLNQVGEVPVPPKYGKADFRNGIYWGLRGALDVPKERFVSFPLASPTADNSLVLAWAGWDHLQVAQALAAHYIHLKDHQGWGREQLAPVLAGLLECVPWLKQWHNEMDRTHGTRMGDYFDGFVQEEARSLGLTMDELRSWRPPAAAGGRRKRAKEFVAT